MLSGEVQSVDVVDITYMEQTVDIPNIGSVMTETTTL